VHFHPSLAWHLSHCRALTSSVTYIPHPQQMGTSTLPAALDLQFPFPALVVGAGFGSCWCCFLGCWLHRHFTLRSNHFSGVCDKLRRLIYMNVSTVRIVDGAVTTIALSLSLMTRRRWRKDRKKPAESCRNNAWKFTCVNQTQTKCWTKTEIECSSTSE